METLFFTLVFLLLSSFCFIGTAGQCTGREDFPGAAGKGKFDLVKCLLDKKGEDILDDMNVHGQVALIAAGNPAKLTYYLTSQTN